MIFAFAVQGDFYDKVARVATRLFFGGSEGLMEGVALEGTFALLDRFEFFEVFAQSAAAHGAFFGDAVFALGIDVGFAFVVEEFDFDVRAGVVPRLF